MPLQDQLHHAHHSVLLEYLACCYAYQHPQMRLLWFRPRVILSTGLQHAPVQYRQLSVVLITRRYDPTVVGRSCTKGQNGVVKLYDLSVLALRSMSNLLRGLKSGRVLYAFAVLASRLEIDFGQHNPGSSCDLRIQASLKRLV